MKFVKLAIAATVALSLSACSQPVRPPLEVVTREIPFSIPVPAMPRAPDLDALDWVVITEDNLHSVLEEMRDAQPNGVVLLALTPSGYEQFEYNQIELRRYIQQQQAVILYYVEATTADAEDPQSEENQVGFWTRLFGSR